MKREIIINAAAVIFRQRVAPYVNCLSRGVCLIRSIIENAFLNRRAASKRQSLPLVCVLILTILLFSLFFTTPRVQAQLNNLPLSPAPPSCHGPVATLEAVSMEAVSMVREAGKGFVVQDTGEDTGDENAGEMINPQAIMVILDKITLQDLEQYAGPYLLSIMEQSGIALMNANTAGSLGSEGGYLTIGSGARLLGSSLARAAFNRDEIHLNCPVEELYRRHTGREAVPDGEILHLYPETLAQLNGNLLYPSLLGALGESLQARGFHTAVLGNADTDHEGRQAVTIAMNADGAVSYGNVGSSLFREDGGFPFGRRSDAGAYRNAFEAVCKKASFIVVEWGDTTRLEAYSGRLPHHRRGELLQSSLAELDSFLLGISPHFHRGVKLVFVTPSPAKQIFTEGQRLTPLFIYEPDLKQKGLLVSSSTRKPGIITNLDLAPTILEHLGAEPSVFLWGTPLASLPTEEHLTVLSHLSERTALIYAQRPGIVRTYITYQIIVLLAGLVMVLIRFKFVQKLRFAYYFLLYLPPAILLAPVFPFFPSPLLSTNIFLIIILAALLTLFAALFFKEPLTYFTFTGLFIFSFLLFDLLHGASLNSRSYLGYDPIGGARFYGMGNEYMGILIGSFLLGFGSLFSLLLRSFPFPKDNRFPSLEQNLAAGGWKRFSLFLVSVLFALFSLLIIFMMASPNYGANFGGALTAGVALAVTWKGLLTLLNERGLLPVKVPQRKIAALLPLKVVLPLLFVLITATLLYFLNVSHSGETVSHLGRTWELVRSNGLPELWSVIQRKMGMNLKLLRWSLWSRVLVLLLSLLVILYYYPVGLVRRILRQEAGFRVLLGGITAGSITAFFVNDSGVVAAATTLFYGALPLLLLAIREVDA
jgi:hypothetical protein